MPKRDRGANRKVARTPVALNNPARKGGDSFVYN